MACAEIASVERTITPNAENLTNLSNIDDLSNISQTDALSDISKIDDILTSPDASTLLTDHFLVLLGCLILPNRRTCLLHLTDILMEI